MKTLIAFLFIASLSPSAHASQGMDVSIGVTVSENSNGGYCESSDYDKARAGASEEYSANCEKAMRDHSCTSCDPFKSVDQPPEKAMHTDGGCIAVVSAQGSAHGCSVGY